VKRVGRALEHIPKHGRRVPAHEKRGRRRRRARRRRRRRMRRWG